MARNMEKPPCRVKSQANACPSVGPAATVRPHRKDGSPTADQGTNPLPASPTTRMTLWMAGWLTATLTMTISGRELTSELPVFVVLLWRSCMGVVIIAPFILWVGGGPLRTRRIRWHLVRNLAHYSAQFCWFLAISLIPLAEVISIEFTMSIWTAILAGMFLGERLTLLRLAAIALGFAGIVIIVQPGLSPVGLGQIAALYAAMVFAVSVVMTKSLTRTEDSLTIVFYMFALQAVIGLVPALQVWVWPSVEKWPWLLALGVAGTASHFCLAKAIASADATVVIPMDFLRLPLTAFAGWLLYSESITVFLVAGAALILFGNVLNLKGLATTRLHGMPSRAPQD
jgi:drug/metabolite transporter (DMT)-like permease